MYLLTATKTDDFFQLQVNGEDYKIVEFNLFRKAFFPPEPFQTKEDLDSWFYELERKLAKNYLYFLLSRRDYLQIKLFEKMKKRLISEKTAKLLVQELEQMGYVDDSRIVKSLVNRYQRKKSRREIIFLLKRERIDVEKFQEILSTISEEEAVRYHIERKKGKGLNKLRTFLFQKGFSSDLIYEETRTLRDQDT